LRRALDQITKRLGSFLDKKPHLKGVPLEQLRRFSPYDNDTTDVLVRFAIENDIMAKREDEYSLPGRGRTLKGPIKDAYEQIMQVLKQDPWSPPKLSEFTSRGKPFREAIGYIVDTGEGHKCGAVFLFLPEVWNEIVGFIRDKLSTDGTLAVSDIRDRFGLTRKFTIPILEETDRIRLTRREGDVRLRGDRFEAEDHTL
jgi:selenocysteine-specific elongation factor